MEGTETYDKIMNKFHVNYCAQTNREQMSVGNLSSKKQLRCGKPSDVPTKWKGSLTATPPVQENTNPHLIQATSYPLLITSTSKGGMSRHMYQNWNVQRNRRNICQPLNGNTLLTPIPNVHGPPLAYQERINIVTTMIVTCAMLGDNKNRNRSPPSE